MSDTQEELTLDEEAVGEETMRRLCANRSPSEQELSLIVSAWVSGKADVATRGERLRAEAIWQPETALAALGVDHDSRASRARPGTMVAKS